jgi:miniconductance mechanosensitive channel
MLLQVTKNGNYEYIMSDIYIAAVPYFGLELYELRSNSEFIKQT